jgi:hypothetical protein
MKSNSDAAYCQRSLDERGYHLHCSSGRVCCSGSICSSSSPTLWMDVLSSLLERYITFDTEMGPNSECRTSITSSTGRLETRYSAIQCPSWLLRRSHPQIYQSASCNCSRFGNGDCIEMQHLPVRPVVFPRPSSATSCRCRFRCRSQLSPKARPSPTSPPQSLQPCHASHPPAGGRHCTQFEQWEKLIKPRVFDACQYCFIASCRALMIFHVTMPGRAVV